MPPPLARATPPGWFADPSGRHQLRWWDGATFSDQVADGGVVSTDDGRGSMPAPLAGDGFVVADGGRPRWALPVGALALVVIVVGVAAVVLSDDRGSGFGEHTGEVAGDMGGAHRLAIPAGSVVTIELRPDDDDFDPRMAFVVDQETFDALADAFDGSDLEDGFGTDRSIGAGELFEELDLGEIGVDADDVAAGPYVADLAFEGDDEELVLLAPVAIEGTLVVGGGFAGTEGTYELTIERTPVDRADDGDDFLDGIEVDDAIARPTRRLIDDLLDRFAG